MKHLQVFAGQWSSYTAYRMYPFPQNDQGDLAKNIYAEAFYHLQIKIPQLLYIHYICRYINRKTSSP